MTGGDRADALRPDVPAQRLVTCTDLDAAIAYYSERLGFRLDMITPADAPRIALLSGDGVTLRLQVAAARDIAAVPADSAHAFTIARADAADAWTTGRAGMQYRDLIPGRLGGRCVASHIRIPAAGPVSDYVHYHTLGFQMIFCKRGWVRVVNEDQGQPFVMRAGDCLLQPPTIRHRVLEASMGLEVIEVSCPAEHETWREYAFDLPTSCHDPDRRFGGQHFVRHLAANAAWQYDAESGCEFRESGIAQATDGLARVRVLRIASSIDLQRRPIAPQIHRNDVLFLLLLEGQLDLISDAIGTHALGTGDACVIPAGADYALQARSPAQILEVAMAADGLGKANPA